MGEIISLTEAVRRYRIGEKTLRKWWKTTGQEKKPDKQKRMVWQIDTDELERLIREHAGMGIPSVPGTIPVSSPYTEQIAALAAELSDQGEVIEALKQDLAELRERVAALESRGKKAKQAQADVEYEVPASASGEIPEDAISLVQMAEELGISVSTFRGHLRQQAFTHIAIPKAGRTNEYTRYFTEAQAERVREWHREHRRQG